MPGAKEPPTFEEEFRSKWATLGLKPNEIDGKWEEFWIIEGERDRLEKKQPPGTNAENWKIEVDKGVRDFERRLARLRKWGR